LFNLALLYPPVTEAEEYRAIRQYAIVLASLALLA
jgi:hypothetical protein